MQTQTLRKTRWFWPWQDEQEETWLREMANQGFHLAKADYFGQYTFQPGEPADVVYRLDFQYGSNKDHDAYLQLFADAGWEHVGVLGGWQYFRKLVKPGEESEIFTDTKSKIEKYGRLTAILVIFSPIYFVLLNNLKIGMGSILGEIIRFLMFLLMLVYIFVMLKLIFRIEKLRKQNIKQ
ncbi:MAG: DUF2812 domain-containing protein [Anaerolineaceae bacterium]|nr:DUF2812 domain-containing protein [Anaerolineaceae bacterium]